MSVLLVTDDADDDIQKTSITSSSSSSSNPKEYIYKQLKELEYDFSSSIRSFSIVESSPSIIVKSNKHYRQDRRRRLCRPQQCLVKHLLTYMLTLLILTNHIHWSLIILSLSSIKLMSTQASTIAPSTTTTNIQLLNQTTSILKRPVQTPSMRKTFVKEDESHQCLPINFFDIDRICSKQCQTRKNPFEKFDNINQNFLDIHFLPFCSYLLNQTIIKEKLFTHFTENECRQTLEQIIKADEEARLASQSFLTYMNAIDSASIENRYSIIISDCQQAYRTWTCSVKIPYYYRNQLIPPCQTICDEVERVCPTFRPSDREPLFAGQPLFFCNGGIVSNGDYGHRPHCFDTCHIFGGSLQRPSSITPPLTSISNTSTYPSLPSLSKFVEGIVTTPTCFEIEPLLSPSSSNLTFLFVDTSMYPNDTYNTSLSASARTITSSSLSLSYLSIILTFIFVFFKMMKRCFFPSFPFSR